jgi:hypothetical protein
MSIERFLAGLAQLETAGGAKTIKDPSGKGFRAFDRVEKSNDAYRVFASREDGTREVLGLLERRYPRALTAKTSREFAEALKAGGYATDKDYVEKLTRVIDGLPADASIIASAAPAPAAAPRAALPASIGAPTATQPENIAAAQEARLADETRREGIQFMDTVRVALGDPDTMLGWQVLDVALRDQEQRPDGWDWMLVRNDTIKDRTLEEIEELDEDANSPAAVLRIIGAQNRRRENNKHYQDAGGWQTFAAGTLASLADPLGIAVNVATAGMFRAARIGSGAYMAAGKTRSAVASAIAESTASELAVTFAADLATGRQTAEDYAIATAAGALFGTLPAASAYRGAAEVANLNMAQDMIDKAIREKLDKPPEVRRQEQAQALTELTGDNITAKKVMPDDLRREIENEYDGRPNEAKKEAKLEADEAAAQERARIQKEADDAVAAGREAPQGPSEPKSFVQELREAVVEMREAHKAGDYTKTRTRVRELFERDDGGMTGLHENYLVELLTEADHAILGSASNNWTKQRPATKSGDPVVLRTAGNTQESKLRDMREETPEKGYNVKETSIRNVLQALTRQTRNPAHAKLAKFLLERLSKRLPGGKDDPVLDTVPVVFKRFADTADPKSSPRGMSAPEGAVSVGMTDRRPKGTARTVEEMRDASLDDLLEDATDWTMDTTLHEIIHAVTQQVVYLYSRPELRGLLTPEVVSALDRMSDVLKRLRVEVKGQYPDSPTWDGKTVVTLGPNYAAWNLDELFTMALTDAATQRMLFKMPASPTFGGKYSNALREVFDTILRVLRVKLKAKRSSNAMDEVMFAFEILMDRRIGGLKDTAGNFLGWRGDKFGPTAGPLDAQATINPILTVNPARKFAARMLEHAREWVRENPIDQDKVRVLTDKIASRSDGIILARSKNPVMQMVAGMVTEVTTGAAGRRATVAIRKKMLESKLTGRAIQDYRAAFSNWLRTNNRGVVSEAVTGDGEREFDRIVYEEILARRDEQQAVSQDPSVRAAADALEQVFTRALDAQKKAGVLGAQRLPPHSVGYIPQALDGRRLATASLEQIQELEAHLAKHWATAIGWSTDFSREFARYYTTRARERVQNTKGVDTAGGDNSAAVIRDTLEIMKEFRANDPAGLVEIKRAEAILAKGGQGHTKHRLDVDLLAELPSGARVIDYYETGSLNLMRRYVGRTSGTVALTEFGIHGATGARHLRRAISESGDLAERATQEELDAFDRVMGEILNGHIEGEQAVRWASNLASLVRVQRLGSLVFTQFAETMNMVHHLGLTTTLKGIASLPQIMGEVGRVKRGAPRNRHLLTHIEVWGGDIGMENYQLRAPLEAPDDRLAEYTRDAGVTARLLSGMQHIQGKVTGFRRLMAAQHRMVAEQIVMKAVRYVQEGKNDIYLKDMGLNDELIAHIRENLDRVASWDDKGQLTRFDVTMLPNPAAAEEFVQMVHRGTSQIIQGTFVGERTAWMHNDYWKVIAQLRTFGITAMEKQWSRTARLNGGGTSGYGIAAMVLVAQMALILPIHLARVHLMSVGREDQEEYIEKNLQPAMLVRAVANYASMSGLLGDFLELTGGVATGWSGDPDLLGGRHPSQLTVAGVIPALGSVDAASKLLLQGQVVDNPYWALKQLPGANIPYVIPFLNLFKE